MKRTKTLFCFVLFSYFAGAVFLQANVSLSKTQTDETATPIVQVGHVSAFLFRGAGTVAISPNNKLIVTGGDDGSIKFWDSSNGLLINTINAHVAGVTALAFSPNGQFVASGGGDSRVRLWNAQTGNLEQNFEGHTTAITCLAFSTDGDMIASGSGSYGNVGDVSDNNIRIWDAHNGILLKTLRGHSEQLASIAFNETGDRLASSSTDKTLKIWSIESGRLLRTIPTEAIGSINYSPDGKTIASAEPQSIIFRDSDTGAEIRRINHGLYTAQVSFTPDWQRVAINGYPITIWDVSSGQQIRSMQKVDSRISDMSFSGDGLFIVGAGDSGPTVWDATRGVALHTFSRQPQITTGITFNRSGDKVAWGRGNEVNIWDVKNARLEHILPGHKFNINEVAFSPDGKMLVSCSNDEIKLWSVASGRKLRDVNSAQDVIPFYESGPGHRYQSLQFSPDGNFLAVGGSIGEDKLGLWLWNTRTWRLYKTFGTIKNPPARLSKKRRLTRTRMRAHSSSMPGGPTTEIHSVSFSPDGTLLATGDEDKNIIIWNVKQGQRLKTLSGHDSAVNSVEFSHDGKRLVSGSFDQTAKIWDVSSGKVLNNITQHHDHVTSVKFSPNDQMVISGSIDKEVRLWNANDASQIATLEGHNGAVTFVAFSPDGKIAASTGLDGCVNIWSLQYKTLISTIATFNDDSWIDFSPDGFYTGTPEALKYMVWRKGNRIVDGSSISQQLNNQEILRGRFLGLEPPYIATKPNFSPVKAAGVVTPPAEYEKKLMEEWKDHQFYALVIGIDNYLNLPPLQNAINDAKEIAKTLKERYGFEVTLLPDATKTKILNELQRYERITTAKSSVLIYYAGHGTYLDLRGQREGNWLPADAERDNRNNWLRSSEILESIKLMKASHILVISDSCFSGALFNRGGPNPAVNELPEVLEGLLKRKSWTLVASGGNEPVSDLGEDGHSVFGRAFLKGLRNMKPNVFSMDKLFQDFIDEDVQYNAHQEPKIRPIPGFDDDGKFIFMQRSQ
jgi:WD40 repeat protein